ncbi:toll-like receptor 13 [Bacillus rossius redtenbacheri]|uniref:toll-like receptor 13 n=1 Tax=Bacillus rossius redtenbacheri TaxID=93214 RepID=UPI002FDCA5A9
MSLSLKIVYVLAVQGIYQAISQADNHNKDVCFLSKEQYTTGIDRSGFLKLGENMSLDVVSLIQPSDDPHCAVMVSPNCYQCPDVSSVFCNSTDSEDVEYLKNAQPNTILRLNLEFLSGMSSRQLDELSISSLELNEGNLSSPAVSVLGRLEKLSTLVLRGQSLMTQNVTDVFPYAKNLTTLVVDFTQNNDDNGWHGLSQGQHGDMGGLGSSEHQEEPPDPLHQDQKEDGPDSHKPPEPDGPDGPDGHLESRNPNRLGVKQKVEGASQVFSMSGNEGKSRSLPHLRVLAVVSGYVTQQSVSWMTDSPIKYLYFRNSVIYTKSFGEIFSRLRDSIEFLDIHDSTMHYDDERPNEEESQCAIEYLLQALKGSNNRTILRGLSAAGVGFKAVPYNALEAVKETLQYLSLYKNDFSFIGARPNNESIDDVLLGGEPQPTFPKMPQLLELDLRDCKIQSLDDKVFTGMPKLTVLLLARNHLISLQADSFSGLTALKILDLSASEFSGILAGFRDVNFTNVPNLEILDVSQTKLPNYFEFSGELPSLKILSLCSSFENFDKANSRMFESMKKLELLNLSGNKFQDGVVHNYIFSGLKSLRELYLAKCSLDDGQKNFSFLEIQHFRNLSSLSVLDLSYNSISFIHTTYFSVFKKLKFINLMNNNIGGWEIPVFSDLTNLNEIILDNNLLTSVTNAMLKDFSNLRKLSILGNQFKCGCDTLEMVRLVNTKIANNITFLNGWLDNLNVCADENKSAHVPFKKYVTNDCSGTKIPLTKLNVNYPHTFVIYFSITLTILSITLMSITYYKWNDIKFFFLIIKNATVLSFFNNEIDSKQKCRLYNYDVFISYSDPNRDWVLDELLPNLENTSNLKVCLHERDFQVGLSILENIISCMDQSRCIILIISLSFIKSNWCQFELHLAQHRLLETKREQLILVLLEDIPRSKRSKMLNYIMKTKTYIVWPACTEDQEARKRFWRRMHQAVIIHKSKNDKTFSFA